LTDCDRFEVLIAPADRDDRMENDHACGWVQHAVLVAVFIRLIGTG